MDDKVEKTYAAWPDRLYIVDKKGKIAYKGGKGPGGFKPAEMASKLRKICAT
jgi:type I thyroxine 5'-deiodinase